MPAFLKLRQHKKACLKIFCRLPAGIKLKNLPRSGKKCQMIDSRIIFIDKRSKKKLKLEQ